MSTKAPKSTSQKQEFGDPERRLNFSLTQLEYVLSVNRHGSFIKAAEICNVTQPTLSMQVQKLEDDLGVTLFDRSKKPILLTDAGKRVVEQMKIVLTEAKQIGELAKSSPSLKGQGQLHLGVIPTISPYILHLLFPLLEKKYPQLSLRITEMQTQQIIQSLENDEIDVGLLATPLKVNQIFELPLFYEPFHVLVSNGHELEKLKKIKYSELKYHDIWLLTEGHCLRNQVLDVCHFKQNKNHHHRFQFESGNLETLKNLVNFYGGYTLLPQLATDKIGSHSHLIPFERPIPAREVGLVYRRKQHRVELIEALGEAIIECIPEPLRKLRPKDLEVLPVD
jgi:LysR family hydrogen peroxide-inducible transcriptional activator